MLFERILVGTCLVLMLTTKIGAFIPLTIFFLTGIYITARKPYRENYHNYRAAANMTIAALVEGMYLCYGMAYPEYRNGGIFLYIPLVICIMLILCVIYNVAAIIYSIYKMHNRIKSQNAKLH